MSRESRYLRKIELLRNEYHRKIVQAICLYDIQFEGWYRLSQPPLETLKSYNRNLKCYTTEPVEIKGLGWDGNVIAVDINDRYIYLRYMDISLINLKKIYKSIKRGEFVQVNEMYDNL